MAAPKVLDINEENLSEKQTELERFLEGGKIISLIGCLLHFVKIFNNGISKIMLYNMLQACYICAIKHKNIKKLF